jgi:phage-related protein
MTAPSSPDPINVRVILTDDLSAPAAIVNKHLKDMEDAARAARIELNRLQTSLRRVGMQMVRTSIQTHNLTNRLRAQAAMVALLARQYRGLQRQMQLQLTMQQRVNASTNRSTRSTRRFGNVLGRMRKIAMLATKGIAMLTVGILALAAAMQVASSAQAIMAVIPAFGTLASLAAFLPTALFALVGAFVALKVATKGVGDAMKAAFSDDAEAFQEALEKLTPSAQKFVKAFREFAPLFKGLGRLMQETMFEPLARRIKPMLEAIFPVMVSGLVLVSKELGLLGAEFLEFLTMAEGKNMLAAYLVAAADLLNGIRSGLKPLLVGFSDMAVAIAPLWAMFTEKLGIAMKVFGLWLSEISKSGQLEQWILTAVNLLKLLGQILGAVFIILGSLFSAAGSAGGSISGLAEVLDRIAAWTSSMEGQEALGSFFQSIVTLAAELVPLLTTVAGIIGKVLAPAIAEIAVGLAPGINAVLQALGEALAILAPHMGPLAESISMLLIALSPLLPVVGKLAALIAQQLARSIGLMAKLLVPVVESLMPAFNVMFGVLGAILEKSGPVIEQVMTKIADAMARMVPFAIKIADLFAEKFVEYFPQFAAILEKMLPIIMKVIDSFGNYFVQALEQLMPHLPDLINAALMLALAFAQVLPSLIPVIEAGLRFLNEVIIPNLPLITWFIELILKLAIGFIFLLSKVVNFVSFALEKLGAFYKFMLDKWQQVYDLTVKPFLNAWKAIKEGFIDKLVAAIENVLGKIGDIINSIKNIPGASFLPGLWTGGPVTPGQKYMTGELGPEMFVDMAGRTRMLGQFGPETNTFSQPGFVIPNHLTGAFEGLRESMDRQQARMANRTREPAMAAMAGRKQEPATVEGDTHYHVTANFNGTGDLSTADIDRTIRKTIKSIERERRERK